jgi:polysaccharide export outer membrane protein
MRTILILAVALCSFPAAAQTPTAPAPTVLTAPAQPVPAVTPAAPATAPVPPAPSSQRTSDYLLGPQDTVKVTVFEEPNLTGSYRIDADGAFSYPFLERVRAAGRSTTEVKDEIQKRLGEGFVRSPQVSVDVEQYRPRNISVVGEVRSPGALPMVGQMTLIEALSRAGYMTSTAGNEILILHAPETPNAPPLSTRVAIIGLQPESNPILRENDTIIVDRSRKVTVSGLVRNPSQVTWERGMTVRVAVVLAGGIAEKGSNRGITVNRDQNGKRAWINVDIDDLVQPDDIIEVRQRRL